MQLYFSPLACSMATRICLYEAGAEATFVEVDAKTKRTEHGEDYRAIHPLGFVPALRIDEGLVLTENAAILQYVARMFPDAGLAPEGELARTRMQQWLCFIGTELHKGLFSPLLDPKAPKEAKEYALEKAPAVLGVLEAHLAGREYLLDRFGVADAYLVTVLGWTLATPIALAKWPVLRAYVTRLQERPSVARAIVEERMLYLRERVRRVVA
jgi:glutathione S-transferase